MASVGRLHRLLQIITLLQSGQGCTARELMAELGVSRRTFFRDLSLLQTAGIPCYHQAGVGYRVARSFFLPPVNLTVPETLGLMLLAKATAAQRGRPLAGAAVAAINKLTATVPEPIRSVCLEMLQSISFDLGPQGATDHEMQHHTLLQRCVSEGRTCRMVYKSPAEEKAVDCTLEPYALHFAARAWYVFGRTSAYPEVRCFKLGRIASLTALPRLFRRPKRFRAADRLGKAWLLIPEGKVHHVVLEFAPKVAVNASEVRWHPTQKHTMLPDGRCRMSFDVDGLGEIAWWVCGYADQVVVRQPAELRRRVRTMLASALASYRKSPARAVRS